MISVFLLRNRMKVKSLPGSRSRMQCLAFAARAPIK